MFSISRQISPERSTFASDLTDVSPITLRIEMQGFDVKFAGLARPNIELNNF